ncbi:MAG: WYL domain-containing protein [Oscillospiraceae bacterium]|jgi:predicted DNA-binding transcriptional regulator YafY|nr:WYL domain-containing protein [Oscillospiraceae bacterium]
MPKSSNQKLKILYLMKILLSETDEFHPLTIGEIISQLAEYNIQVERKTVYDDIEALRLFGLDIKLEKSKSYYYFVANRDFELPELKLLVDAVQSSKFITAKKSAELIKKLEGFCSRFDAVKLQRQVFVQNRVKAMNESIYYNVDAIHEAIASGKKISFKYFDYTVKKEKVFRKSGNRYTVSPLALSLNDENYYLISKSAYYVGLTHYRVDKMNSISVLDEPRELTAAPFNTADYAKKVFGMYGGEETDLKLRFENQLAGVVIDRFGKDVSLRSYDENHFEVNLTVAVSPVFIGWLLQFGDMVTVLSPESLIEELKIRATRLLDKYK